MSNIINLTPHDLNLHRADGTVQVIPSSGVARVATTEEVVGDLCGVPLVRQTFGEPEGLPEGSPETTYVVSGLVRSALPGRADVASPARLVRDEGGRVVGAAALAVNGASAPLTAETEENLRLKAEVERLKAEVDRLEAEVFRLRRD